jgi:hypothetical protein
MTASVLSESFGRTWRLTAGSGPPRVVARAALRAEPPGYHYYGCSGTETVPDECHLRRAGLPNLTSWWWWRYLKGSCHHHVLDCQLAAVVTCCHPRQHAHGSSGLGSGRRSDPVLQYRW